MPSTSLNPVIAVRLTEEIRDEINWLCAHKRCSMADLFTLLVDREYQKEYAKVVSEPIDFAALDAYIEGEGNALDSD